MGASCLTGARARLPSVAMLEGDAPSEGFGSASDAKGRSGTAYSLCEWYSTLSRSFRSLKLATRARAHRNAVFTSPGAGTLACEPTARRAMNFASSSFTSSPYVSSVTQPKRAADSIFTAMASSHGWRASGLPDEICPASCCDHMQSRAAGSHVDGSETTLNESTVTAELMNPYVSTASTISAMDTGWVHSLTSIVTGTGAVLSFTLIEPGARSTRGRS